jgi:16S rRNA pseudouridine516 synthase
MQLSHILFSQGFGTRRECAALVSLGLVALAGRVLEDPALDLDTSDLVLHVRGKAWPYHAKAVVALHKPAGFECSAKPKHHPSVLSLLPEPLQRRGVQCVGRLDEDTTGLLLLTDDGALIHRLTHPKRHVPKVYEVTTKHPITDAQVSDLVSGVVLIDDPEPARAEQAVACSSHHLRLTLTDGRYHQVKRMLAAVGNRCEALHRSAVGRLTLPAALPLGHWAWVSADSIESNTSALSA